MAEESAITYDVVALAELRNPRWVDLKERVAECLRDFRCARSVHLQNFARNRVDEYELDEHSRTYVLITPVEGTIDVAGFFTVGITQLDLSKASGNVQRKLTGRFSHEQTGAYSIAELARDDRYSSTELPGRTILDEAFSVIARSRKHIGGRFVVVDAREEVIESLYRPKGFRVVGVAEAPLGMEEVEFRTACCQVKGLGD